MRTTRWHKNDGSALITAAIAAGVLSIVAAGYLTAITNQYVLDSRTHKWQQALNLAEAAAEVGIAELNYQHADGQGFQSARGWVDLGAGRHYARTVSNVVDLAGNSLGDYTVIVSNATTWTPQITAIGTCANSRGPAAARAIGVNVRKTLNYAFLSRTGVSFTHSGFEVDSYDSSDPTKSTNGLYDPAKKQPNGHMSTLSGTLTFKGPVYGTLTVSGTGTVNMSGGGSIGNTFNTLLRSVTVPDAVLRGYIRNAPAPSLPLPTVPFNIPSSTPLGAISGNYTITGDGDYNASSITANTGQKVRIVGHVRLYVSGETKLSGGQIEVPAGSSLELYQNGKITMSGSSAINNANRAENAKIFGLSTGTWALTGSGAFVAIIYAPDVDVTLTGGSNIAGAMVARNISTSGAGAFRYDEALGTVEGTPYVVLSWKEYRQVDGVWVP